MLAPRAVRIDEARLEDGERKVRWIDGGEALVVLARDTGRDMLGVVCHGPDGEARVPAEALERLGPGEAQLAAARIRRAPLLVDGLSDAELLFITRDTIDLTIPEPAPEDP